uniref:Guanylate cyclase domain-containing protein n=1 Tax=Eutreptiella gymnastica TaxID=73025 RepID=A0A7S1IRM5_9EUGL|mmetsp:Transcript_3630/g.6347  ORF Transcript_3630/g.6347 Transcript_3630/m.6347 type:complete len:2027 (+) Transcript_3630:28-6108(+)
MSDHGSVAASSAFSGSTSASSGWGRSRSGGFVGTFILKLEPRIPKWMEALFTIVELIQLVSFSFIPNINWFSPIYCFFNVTHLPIWDQTGSCLPYDDTLELVVHLLALTIVLIPSIIALVMANMNDVGGYGRQQQEYARRGIEILGTLLARPLFIPCLRILLHCGWQRHWAMGAISFAFVIPLVTLACFVKGFLFDFIPTSKSLFAKAHGRTSIAQIVVLVVIALLSATTSTMVCQVMWLLLSLCMVVLYWYTQPFYHQFMNIAYVSVFGMCCISACVAIVLINLTNEMVLNYISWAWLGATPIILILGWWITGRRFTTQLPIPSEAYPTFYTLPFMDVLSEAIEASELDLEFPSKQALKEVICLPIFTYAGVQGPVLGGSVRVARFCTDIELSLRFMHNRPDFSPDFLQNVIVYANKVYEEALRRWPDNALVQVQYAIFLATYPKNSAKSMSCCRNAAMSKTCSWDAFCMSHRMATILNLRNVALADLESQAILRQARKHHRQALLQTRAFWHLLMSDSVDVHTMNKATLAIDNHTQSAIGLFQDLLEQKNQKKNPTVLRHVAHFLRTITHDKDAADMLVAEAEVLEENGEGMSRFASSVDRTSKVSSNGKSMLFGGNQLLQSSGQGQSGSLTNTQGSNNLIQHVRLTFFALCCILSFSCGTYFYYNSSLQDHVAELVEASVIVSASAKASALTLLPEIQSLDNCGIQIAEEIRRVSAELRYNHKEITIGDRAVHGEALDFFRTPRITIHTTLDSKPRQVITEIMSIWDMGHLSYEKFMKVADIIDSANSNLTFDTTGHRHKFHTLAGGPSNGISVPSEILWVRENVPTGVLHGWNVTLAMLVEDADNQIWDHAVIQIILTISVVTMLLGISVVYGWSFRRINIEKSIVLNLFTHIPFPVLEKLADELEVQISQMDKPDDHGGKQQSVDGSNKDGLGKMVDVVQTDSEDHKGLESGLTNTTEHGADAGDNFVAADGSDDLLRNKTLWVLIGALLVQFLLSMAAVVTIYFIMITQSSIPKAIAIREESLWLAKSVIDNADEMTQYARAFAQFGEKHNYDMYWKLAHSGNPQQVLNRLVELGVSKEEQLHMAAANDDEHIVANTEMVSMRMIVAAQGFDPHSYPDVEHHQWDAHSETAHFDWSSHTDRGLHYTSRDHDLATSPKHLRDVARSILFDAKYDHDKHLVEEEIDVFHDLLVKRTEETIGTASDAVMSFIIASCVIYAALLACFVVVIFVTNQLGLMDRKVLMICLSAIIVVIAVLVMLGTMSSLKSQRLERALWKQRARDLANEEQMLSVDLATSAQKFVQFGDMAAYNRYWQVAKGPRWEGVITDIKALGLTEQETNWLDESHHLAVVVEKTQEISMLLAVWSFGLNPHMFPDVEHVQWDADAEPDMDEQKLNFPTRAYWYSSRANDMKLSPDQQRVLGRSLLYDVKFDWDMDHVRQNVDQLTKSIDKRATVNTNDMQKLLDVMAYAVIGSTALFIFVSVGMVTFLMSKVLNLRAASMTEDEILSEHTNQRKFSIAILLGLFSMVGVFAFAILHIAFCGVYPSEVSLSADREWLLTRALYYGEAVTWHHDTVSEPDRVHLEADLQLLKLKRQQLYFKADTSDGHRHYIGDGTLQSRTTFEAGGVNEIMHAWIQKLTPLTRRRDVPSTTEELSNLHYMWCTYKDLFQKLEDSRDEYVIEAEAFMKMGGIVEVIIVICVTIFIIFEYLVLVTPTIDAVVKAEESTKALLTLIPGHVLATVPAIKNYMETGTIVMGDDTNKKNLEETDQLLAFILPPSICERLKAGENPIAEYCKGVTIMFTHLVGFTKMVSMLPARELVGLLNSVFTAYDKLVESKELEKIKTVGDAYMMAANLLKKKAHCGAKAVVECGLEFLDILETLNTRQAAEFQLQQTTGVNTGNVVAGVLGYTSVAFDIWGDAVNIASRMESTGDASAVQVSPSTWEIVKPYYEATEHSVFVKGKGQMPSYRIYHGGIAGKHKDAFAKNKELDFDQRSLESNHLNEDDTSDISIDDIPLPAPQKK